jgi:hypothetical protein
MGVAALISALSRDGKPACPILPPMAEITAISPR